MDPELLANIRSCENARSGLERAAKRARRTQSVCSLCPRLAKYVYASLEGSESLLVSNRGLRLLRTARHLPVGLVQIERDRLDV